MRFHEHTVASFIPDFVEIQQDSFSTFLNQGLLKELSKINPIRDKTYNLELLFYPKYYKLTHPTCTPTEAILRLKTYVSKLYVPVQLINKDKTKIKLDWFYLCDLPLMAKRGHFIVNGCPRVVVNQIIRSPGIYYQNCVINSMATRTEKYYADIIPTTGTWLRLESNHIYSYKRNVTKQRVWARMKRVGKLSGFLFLCCFKPKKWKECTNAIDHVEYKQLASTAGLEQMYPFIGFLRNVFFKYYFKKRYGVKNQYLLRDVFFKDYVEEMYVVNEEDLINPSNTYGKTSKYVKNSKLQNAKLLNTLLPNPNSEIIAMRKTPFKKKKKKKSFSVTERSVTIGAQNKISTIKRDAINVKKKIENIKKQIFLKEQKQKDKKKKFYWKEGLEKKIEKISEETGETKEQLLEDRDYSFAFLFFESGLKVSSIKKNLYDIKNAIKAKKKREPRKFKDYSTEEYVKLGSCLLFNKFFDTKTYNLGLMGRLRLNKKFGLYEKKYTLTQSDIFYALNHLFVFKKKKWLRDDIDSLKNKRVKASGELIENVLTTGLLGLKEQLLKNLEKMKEKGIGRQDLNLDQLVTTKPIHGVLRVFFGSSPLSQYLDQTNPLADITHKRRVSCLGPGGLSRETAGMAVRNIHPTHYGRICPIETPEGRNAGLVNSIALYGRINFDGYLQTPFYNVYQGQIQKTDFLVDCQRPTFFSVEQEAGVAVSAGDLKFGKLNFPKTKINTIKSKIEYFSEVTEKIEYIAMSPIQMISVATSLIPFLKHDDATRGLMGSNMQRQSIPTIFPERPIVGTGLEARVAAESGHVVTVKSGGYVSYASGKQIVIIEKKEQKNRKIGKGDVSLGLRVKKGIGRDTYSRKKGYDTSKANNVSIPFLSKYRIPFFGELGNHELYPFFARKKTKETSVTIKKKETGSPYSFTKDRISSPFTETRFLFPLYPFYSLSCKVLTAKKGNPKKRFYKKIDDCLSKERESLQISNNNCCWNNNNDNSHLTENLLKQKNIKFNILQQIKQGIPCELSLPFFGRRDTKSPFVSLFLRARKSYKGIKLFLSQHPLKNNFYPLSLNSCPKTWFQYKTCQNSFEKIKNFRFLSTSFFQGKMESRNSFSKKKSVGTKIGKGYVSLPLRVKKGIGRDTYSRKKGDLNQEKRETYPKVGSLQGKGYVSLPLRVKKRDNYVSLLSLSRKDNCKKRDTYPKVGTKIAVSLPLRVKKGIGRDTYSRKKRDYTRKFLSLYNLEWVSPAANQSFLYFLLHSKAYTENLFFIFFLSLYNSKKDGFPSKFQQVKGYKRDFLPRSNNFDAQAKKISFYKKEFLLRSNRKRDTDAQVKGDFLLSVNNKKDTKTIAKRRDTYRLLCSNSKRDTNSLIVKIFLFFNILQIPFYLPFRSLSYFFKNNEYSFEKQKKRGIPKLGVCKGKDTPCFVPTAKGIPKLGVCKRYPFSKQYCAYPFKVPNLEYSFTKDTIFTRDTDNANFFGKQDLSQQKPNTRKKKKRDVVETQKKQLQALCTKDRRDRRNRRDTRCWYKARNRLGFSLIIKSLFGNFYLSIPFTPFIFCNKGYKGYVKQKKMSRSARLKNNILYSLRSLKLNEKQKKFSSGLLPQRFTKRIPLGYLSFWGTLVLGYWENANSVNSKRDTDANFVRKQKCWDKNSKGIRLASFQQQKGSQSWDKVSNPNSFQQQKTVSLYKGYGNSCSNNLLAERESYSQSYSHSYSLESYRRSNQATCLSHRPSVLVGEWVQKADLLADCASSVLGDVSVGKNLLVAYMPWEGYNFEDAILISERLISDDIYTSIHIERFSVSIRQTKFGIEHITENLPELMLERLKGLRLNDKFSGRVIKLMKQVSRLDNRGVGVIGNWYQEEEILVAKVTPIPPRPLSPHEKLLYDILELEPLTVRDTSLRVPNRLEGKINNVEIFDTKNLPPGTHYMGPGCVHIFFVEKLKIQVGDKLSGRHGNKGIVSKIIPRQDMPYLPNGTPIDMVLNPLGVPSRMNVGQVFEALLGLAGLFLNESFKIKNFDNSVGNQASRSLVYSKLYQASITSGENWLFNPKIPGKTRVFDGRTGECFEQSVTVGQSYMLKLIHLVDHKIHARSTGPYSLITQQPVKGRSRNGGQRVGEMEVWALQGFGAAYALQEILTIKSDDMIHRRLISDKLLDFHLDDELLNPKITLESPETFKVLIAELQSVCVGLELYDKITPIDLPNYIFSGERNKTNKHTKFSFLRADWKNIKKKNKITRYGSNTKNKISFLSFPFFINKKLDQKNMCFSKKPSLFLKVFISELQSLILIKPYDNHDCAPRNNYCAKKNTRNNYSLES